MQVRTRVFTLPGQEAALDALRNNSLITIVDEKIMPCPKELVFLVYIKYEDSREGA